MKFLIFVLTLTITVSAQTFPKQGEIVFSKDGDTYVASPEKTKKGDLTGITLARKSADYKGRQVLTLGTFSSEELKRSDGIHAVEDTVVKAEVTDGELARFEKIVSAKFWGRESGFDRSDFPGVGDLEFLTELVKQLGDQNAEAWMAADKSLKTRLIRLGHRTLEVSFQMRVLDGAEEWAWSFKTKIAFPKAVMVTARKDEVEAETHMFGPNDVRVESMLDKPATLNDYDLFVEEEWMFSVRFDEEPKLELTYRFNGAEGPAPGIPSELKSTSVALGRINAKIPTDLGDDGTFSAKKPATLTPSGRLSKGKLVLRGHGSKSVEVDTSFLGEYELELLEALVSGKTIKGRDL